MPQFEAVLDTLEVGEISEPFPTPFGMHIVQLMDRREHDATDELKRSRVVDELRERKAIEETDLWLRQLRDEAYVEIRL